MKKKEISKINKNNFEKKIKKIIKYDFLVFFSESSIKDVCLRLLSKFFVDKNTTWKYSELNFLIINYVLEILPLILIKC